jgi:hypothetical protein
LNNAEKNCSKGQETNSRGLKRNPELLLDAQRQRTSDADNRKRMKDEIKRELRDER